MGSGHMIVDTILFKKFLLSLVFILKLYDIRLINRLYSVGLIAFL